MRFRPGRAPGRPELFPFTLRGPVRRLILCFSAAITVGSMPTLAYEALQKTAERVGPCTVLLRNSADAERRVPWRPRLGVGALDHAAHELAETRLFWQLTMQRGWKTPAEWAEPLLLTSSARPVAMELADR
jgi:hypothetical protein